MRKVRCGEILVYREMGYILVLLCAARKFKSVTELQRMFRWSPKRSVAVLEAQPGCRRSIGQQATILHHAMSKF